MTVSRYGRKGVESRALLEVEGLSVTLDCPAPGSRLTRDGRVDVPVLKDLSLNVAAGELVAVVGASGSGKTVLVDALLGLYPSNAEVRGDIRFDGAPCDARRLASLRGHGIAMVPQSVSFLDPTMTVGRQVAGCPRGKTRAARRLDAARREGRARELFAAYGLAPEVAGLFPHELSGGMARRVLLMCALMEDPRLLIADEPTVGLDRELALRALADLRAFADAGGAVLMVTHELGLAARAADRVAVIGKGGVVEQVSGALFDGGGGALPSRARSLWNALPEHGFWDASPGKKRGAPSGFVDARSIDVAAVHEGLVADAVRFAYPGGDEVLADVSLVVEPGERVALLGPSGCGKTTLCRILAGYEPPSAGSVGIRGPSTAQLAPGRHKGPHPVQLVWQQPIEAFDPYVRVGESMAEAAGACGEGLAGAYFSWLCARLNVSREWMARYPCELSGGELMRCGVLRAMLARPRYLIADEITASLDACSQASVWRAVVDICEEQNIGLLFTTHDHALASRVATRVIAMENGMLA